MQNNDNIISDLKSLSEYLTDKAAYLSKKASVSKSIGANHVHMQQIASMGVVNNIKEQIESIINKYKE